MNTITLKQTRIAAWGQWASQRTHGSFKGHEWANKMISVDFIGTITRKGELLRQMILSYATGAHTKIPNADPDTLMLRLQMDKPTFIHTCNHAMEMLLDVDLQKIQFVHCVLLRNTFQASDPRLFRTDDPELQLIFDVIEVMVNVHNIANKGMVVQANVWGVDYAQLLSLELTTTA
eukprot:c5870_g1_i2.p1 GENE.c5870_g1_i2~~c5870_g1_i2.p1  ORF type:complete len:176 (+),score=48.59 c5870_g1_i2:59-586(+)